MIPTTTTPTTPTTTPITPPTPTATSTPAATTPTPTRATPPLPPPPAITIAQRITIACVVVCGLMMLASMRWCLLQSKALQKELQSKERKQNMKGT